MAEENFFGDYGNPSSEQKELAAKLSEVFEHVKDVYNETYNINERLEYDDALLDDLQTALAMLIRMESGEEEHDDKEMMEQGYLKAIDCIIRMAKVIHPTSGFGAERMLSAYELLDTFEEVYHPVLTKITEENIGAFAELLSDKEYDEVLYKRKKAIGALRTEGKDTYAAGVAVYRSETAPVLGTPVIRLDRIYVADEFRSFGTGNLLMAALIRPIITDPDARLVVSYKPLGTTDDDDEEYALAVEDEFDRTEEFLSSWKFDFSVDLSRDYYISLADVEKASFVNISKKGIVSLKDLGKNGPSTIKKFFTMQNNEFNAGVIATPWEYYDGEASCVYMEDGTTVDGLLLCHRYKDGDYRLDYIGFDPEDAPFATDVIMRMLCFAHDVVTERGDADAMVVGETGTEEGFQLLKKLAPNAKAMVSFDGILSPLDTDQTISTADWDMLRKEAGLLDDIEPEAAEEG